MYPSFVCVTAVGLPGNHPSRTCHTEWAYWEICVCGSAAYIAAWGQRAKSTSTRQSNVMPAIDPSACVLNSSPSFVTSRLPFEVVSENDRVGRAIPLIIYRVTAAVRSCYRSSSPRRTAIVTAWVRPFACNLSIRFLMWKFTVVSAINSLSAICLLR